MKHHAAQREYWRSLEHLANTPETQQLEEHEFASYDPDGMVSMPSVTRRRFMQLMSASMALGGLTLSGCRRWPQEKLAPYTSNPANRMPGVQEQYATIMELNGVGSPLLVNSFDGRPIKIEGNPTHPFSQTVAGKIGASDAIAQASILEMYDPQRSMAVMNRGGGMPIASDWGRFVSAIQPMIDGLAGSGGSGLAILMESTFSLTTARLKEAMGKRFGQAKWFEYEPLSRDNELLGGSAAVGKRVRQMLQLDQAEVAVFLDADPLGTHPAHVRYASDWASGRRSADQGQMSRVYVAESAFTITGTVADRRLPVGPSRIGVILAALGEKLGVGTGNGTLSAQEQKFVEQAAADLDGHRGKAVISVGFDHGPELHALALAINGSLGAVGKTVMLYEEPGGDRPSHVEAIGDLVKQLNGGQVKTLLILGGNPVYDAPAELNFSQALKSARTSVHLSLFDNETSHECAWHVPRAHYLEAWGDARAWDGTVSICQPLIEPLFGGKTFDQMLALWAGEPDTESDAIVRKTFADILPDGDFRRALNDGMLADSAFKNVSGAIGAPRALPAAAAAGEFQVRFQQDLSLYDGRFAANGWLQEMPDPLTKVVWDNAALVSKKDADKLGVVNGDVLNISVGDRSLEMAAFVLPGQPAGVIGLPLGYGRTFGGHIGTDVGFNTYGLRTSAGWFFADAKVAKTGATYDLAMTQDHHLIDSIGIEKRQEEAGEKHKSSEIIKEATLADWKRDPALFQRKEDGSYSLQLYSPPREFNDPSAWGMSIDLSTCIGCHACVAACQAENNVPIVGKDQVQKNRQMHWIRIDRYFKGDADDPSPEVVYQPLTCQQCENAPCEQVCPVGATMHDTEGLNVMVYNRCVGTRYCSNNCPYKVRRFNYLDWHQEDPRHDKYPKPFLGIPDQQQGAAFDGIEKIKSMMFNPEVTVRMRGVMEKCTYCVQRIHTTQIAKRNAGEKLADGDIITACQQACPTQAIVFGDLNDPNSQVSVRHKNKRAYALLDEALDTRPRNRFLAKISNPSEEPTAAS